MASGSTAMLRRAVPHRALLEPRPLRHTAHQIRPARSIQRGAEFLLLRNRGLGPLAVTVLAIPLARRAAATACAAVESAAPLFCRW